MAASYSTSTKPTYVKIASYTVPSNTTSYTFTNIPQNFTDLVLIVSGYGAVADGYSILCQVGNGSADTGSNYSTTRLGGDGSTATSGRASNATYMRLMNLTGQSTTSSNITNLIINFMNYSNSVTNKTVINRANQTSGSYPGVEALVNLWRSTAAINTITLFPFTGASFATGLTLTLYGIEAAKTPKATGGIITTDGTYWYHKFIFSGLFSPLVSSLSVDYLVVAGGGGGGSGSGGGGGAGGYRTSIGGSTLSLSSVAYPVIVGAGGAGSTGFAGGVGSGAKSGSTSIFSSISSTGGGLGGTYSTTRSIRDGGSGGSGGGGSGIASVSSGGTGNAGSYSPVEGYAGYQGNQSNNTGGGGGGASAAATGVNGANGTSNSISGSSVTYAGGGGGGSADNVTTTGGSGGGAAGNGVAAGSNGTTNLGGGGSGGGYNGSTAQTYNGGNGGSGIVIVRYAV